MREEIAEQLGVTPTPGGLEVLLRQSENNRMAHGGIVHMNQGGSAGGDFVKSLIDYAPVAIANTFFPGFMQLTQLHNKQKTQNKDLLTNPWDKKAQKDAAEDTLTFAQKQKAGTTGAGALMRIGTGIGRHPGYGGDWWRSGKGAGGSLGKTMRKIRKEKKALARLLKQYGDMPSVQDYVRQKEDMGFGRGAYDAFERVAANPPQSAADSGGKPMNFAEMKEYYIKNGGFGGEGAPKPIWGSG